MTRQRPQALWLAGLLALTLVALAVRVLAGRQSLGGDELFSLQAAYRPTLADVISGVQSPLEITPPGWFVFGWAAGKLGDPTYWLKVPSIVAGTLTVPATYALGVKTVGRGAGLVGGLLIAISPYAVFYGSEARAYALAGLFVVLAALALLIAVERGRWYWWVALGAAVAAAMYTHYVTAFPLAVLFAWGLWAHRDRWRPLVLAYAGAAVAYIPWIPDMLDDRTSPYQHAISQVWPFSLSYVGTAIGQWTTGVPTWRVAKVPGPFALGLLVAAVVLLAGGLVFLRTRTVRRTPPGAAHGPEFSRRLVLLVGLALSGPVLAALWSLFEPSVFVPRTFAGSLPPLALLVGCAVMSVPRPVGIAAAACLVVALAIGTLRTFGDFARPPFRDAATFLNDHAGRGQPALETGVFDPGALEPHLHPGRPVFRRNCANASTGPGQLLIARVSCGRTGSGIAPATAAGRKAGRLWVVSWGQRPQAPPGFRSVSVHRFDGGLGIWVAETVPA